MNHIVTTGDVLLTVGAFVGLLLALFGGLDCLAAANVPAPKDGEGTTGCVICLAGLVICLGCIAKMVLS